MLLYERFLGRPFAGHRDSVSELVGDVLESAIEGVLAGADISFRKTKRAQRIPGFDQTPDFVIPSEFNPQVVIEAKITEDDGTARDKVTRVQHLGALSMEGLGIEDPPKFEVVACIAGRGFKVRREDMKKLLLATRGKVFTLQNLEHLISCTRALIRTFDELICRFVCRGAPSMPEISADPPAPSCYRLFREPGIEESQPLDPDPFLPRARDAGGRFAKGSSGNPRGRPPGIRNPRRRLPDLVARPLSAQALSDLLDRKPHLLRPLAGQLLPPPASFDPAEHLGIDLNSVRTARDCRQVLATVLAAVGRGEIAPAEGARIAERVRVRLRAVRRLARVAQLIGETS